MLVEEASRIEEFDYMIPALGVEHQVLVGSHRDYMVALLAVILRYYVIVPYGELAILVELDYRGRADKSPLACNERRID